MKLRQPDTESLCRHLMKCLWMNLKLSGKADATAFVSGHRHLDTYAQSRHYDRGLPIVGSERQSEDLVNYLLREFEEDPGKIWESNIFGTSLYGLVNEGLHNKLYRMPTDARIKLKETVERIINEGCSGLICIIV